ncbi:MAG TPA: sigma-70 family RNA polymerase sigma factor [Candidatus Hydrogenedentes bacterium]|nr:sigma-70 family RNA polymerase sigma factor [Candidatus Hydrogenedentota bacterium]
MSSNLHEEDQRLVQACVKGGDEAWRVFKKKYDRLIKATVYSMAQRMTIPEYEVEDLTSNVYEKLFINSAQCLQQWRGQARLSTYLVQITRNLCTDYARVRLKMRSSDESSKILKHMPVHAHTFEDDNDRQALLDVLHEGMGKIPSQQAVILKMRMEGATLREIADMLRLPVGTVSVYNSRAMATMRERLTLSRKS